MGTLYLRDDLNCVNLIIGDHLETNGYDINTLGFTISPTDADTLVDINGSQITTLAFVVDDPQNYLSVSSDLFAEVVISVNGWSFINPDLVDSLIYFDGINLLKLNSLIIDFSSNEFFGTIKTDYFYSDGQPGNNNILMDFDGNGSWSIDVESGTVNLTYSTLSYSNATGGADFIACTSDGNVNNHNNSGWLFNCEAFTPKITMIN